MREALAFHERTANLLRSILGEVTCDASAMPIAAAPLDDDLIDLATAAKLLRKGKEATRRWLRRNGLRELIAGRVYVRESRLREHLARAA